MLDSKGKLIYNGVDTKENAMNDGTEAAELFNSNIFELSQLQGKLKRSKLQGDDAYRQLGDSLALLRESRDLLGVVMDHQLQTDILNLICKIDEFLPQGE